MKYLGILIEKKRTGNSEWNGPIGKIEKNLGSWIGKHMSVSGRTIVINSSITSLNLYMLSFYRLPVGVGKKFNTLSSNFLWLGGAYQKEISFGGLVRRLLAKRPRRFGVLNLGMINMALLSKWL
jgi:hypothetical protein